MTFPNLAMFLIYITYLHICPYFDIISGMKDSFCMTFKHVRKNCWYFPTV